MATPRNICPNAGAILLDRRATIPLIWSPYQYGSYATSTVDAVPTAEMESGLSTWTYAERVRTGDGTQANMAYAYDKGIQSSWHYDGVTFAASGVVADIEIVANALGVWPNNPGYPGDAGVRYILAYEGEEIARLDHIGANRHIGGTIPITETATVSVFEYFEAILGPRFTIAQFQALIGASDDVLRLLIHTYVGSLGYVTQWNVGKTPLRVTYYTSAPDYQVRYQVRVANNVALTSPVIDEEIADTRSDVDRYFIPPETLDAGLWYWSVNLWGASGSPTGWSTPTTFMTASEAASQVAHGLRGSSLLVELELLRRFRSAAWKMVPSGLFSSTKVYRTVLDDDDEVLSALMIRDWVIDSKRARMTEVFEVGELQPQAGSWFYDKLGYKTNEPLVEPNTIYMHAPDSKSPSCTGLSRGAGLSAVIVLPCSDDGGIVSGPRNDSPYLPIVVGSPEFGQAVDDFSAGRRQSVSGGLALKNAATQMRDEGDGVFRLERPLFYRLLQSVVANPSSSLSPVNASVSISALPQGAAYDERIPLFEGELRPDRSALLTDGRQVRFDVLPRTTLAEGARLGADKYDLARFPYLGQGVEGATIQEIYGAGHARLEARLVDTGEVGVRPAKLCMGKNVSAVSSLLEDGTTPTTMAWTPNYDTQMITVGTSSLIDIEKVRARKWFFAGDGPALPNYAGTPSATLQAGALLRYLIDRMGGVALASSFNAIDDTAIGGESYAVRFVVDQEMLIREAIGVIEQTRLVYVVERGGQYEAVAMWPEDFDAHSTVIREQDLVSLASWSYETEHMARTVNVEFMGWEGTIPAMINQTSATDYIDAEGTYLDTGSRTVRTFHATRAGAEWVRDRVRSSEPIIGCDIKMRNPAHLIQVGSCVMLALTEALDPTGEQVADRLWQVRSRQGRTLKLRRAASVPAWKRAA